MNYRLECIDFTHHWKMLRAQCAVVDGMAIVDTQANSSWCSSTLKPKAIAKLASQLITKHQQPLNAGKPLSVVHEDIKLITLAMLDANQQLICIMIGASTNCSKMTIADDEQMIQAMHRVKVSVLREITLLGQLDTVSEELGDRYEELNLLYSTENDIRNVEEPAATVAQMVEKTILHLRVDAVGLIIPSKGLQQIQIAKQSPLSDKQVTNIIDVVLEKAIETGTPIIANDDKDSDGGLLFTQLTCKCVAIPLLSFTGVVEGVLVALNSPESSSFRNSDLNLMDVVAQRVRWILESNSDPLTGLLARHAFEKQLQSALVGCQTNSTRSAVLNINIDQLHVINDICSPQAGDQAICQVGRIIDSAIGNNNHAARLGGDEFGVLLRDASVKEAFSVAHKICNLIAKNQFDWGEDHFDLSASVGIGPITKDSNNTDELLGAAEIACDEAKAAGGGRARVLEQNDHVLLMRQKQMRWIAKLQAALRESKFVLYAQPIQSLNADIKHIHHEVLIRLADDKGNHISPAEFLPAAERYNMMPKIDRWVIDNFLTDLACHWNQLDASRKQYEKAHSSWAINLSGQSMCDGRLLQFIIDSVEKHRIPAEIICFEITESAAVHSINDARRMIAALRARGFKFSLDDFGTGVSSFAYLKNLPVDYLKIDGSFVKPILEDIASEAVVSAISQIATALDLKTIAEFVENSQIADKLRSIGIDYGQGYGFAKPMPLDQVLDHWAHAFDAVSA